MQHDDADRPSLFIATYLGIITSLERRSVRCGLEATALIFGRSVSSMHFLFEFVCLTSKHVEPL